MIDRQTEETASLYVLDLLSEAERRAFESRLRKSPELSDRVRELAETVNHLAHATPKRKPPDRALDAIYSRIERRPARGLSAKLARVNRIPAAWPLAACMMLGLAVFLLVADRTGRAILEQDLRDSGAAFEHFGEALEEMRQIERDRDRLGDELSATEQELARIHERYRELLEEHHDTRHAEAYLRRELQKMRDQAFVYHLPREGIARLVVIELVDSSSEFAEFGFVDQALQRLSEIGHQITYAHQLIPGTRQDDVSVSPSGEWDADESRSAVVTSGQILRDAPGAVGEDLVRDPSEAQETSEGAEEPGRVRYQPSGFSIWDETEQVGTLSVYDLPELPENAVYQLWIEDPAHDLPINVGMLPELDDGTGMVYYQVDMEQVTPVNVLITQEPRAGSPYPAGPVILRGPGGADPRRGSPQP